VRANDSAASPGAASHGAASHGAVFRKAYLGGTRPGIQVPVREVLLTSGDVFTLYDTSGPHTDPAHTGGDVLPPLRASWITERDGPRGGSWGVVPPGQHGGSVSTATALPFVYMCGSFR
jgi:hypothetical protein